jgi:hypothetical protein
MVPRLHLPTAGLRTSTTACTSTAVIALSKGFDIHSASNCEKPGMKLNKCDICKYWSSKDKLKLHVTAVHGPDALERGNVGQSRMFKVRGQKERQNRAGTAKEPHNRTTKLLQPKEETFNKGKKARSISRRKNIGN